MKELPELFPSGHRLGKYQLLRRLAVGGMAEIYLARSSGMEGFEKLVVLKRILPQHALDPQLLRMFLDEARLMATLTNPHITQVYDVGSDGETPFFTMEHVHGANLREIMNAAAAAGGGDDPRAALIPLPHAIGILAAAAAGLHYAHDKRGKAGEPLAIVHRDVSPSNVLVTYDGSVKVSDFGIAKWSSQRSQTQEGALKGKFAYMSPEQCRGEPIDRRSDVFALGTLLYEVTTGGAPFGSASDYEILNQIVHRDAPPPALPDGSYPPELGRIVRRALARAPADRYPTAQALQLDLEAFAREEKLLISTVGLAHYMSALFADRLESWRLAQQSGKSLEEHLAENLDGAELGALKAARTERTTATDAFAGPPRAPRRPALGAARALAAIVVLAVLTAGGVKAGLKLRRDSRRQVQAQMRGDSGEPAHSSAAPPTRPEPRRDILSTATQAANTVESHSAASLISARVPVTAGPKTTGKNRSDRSDRRAGRPRTPPGETRAAAATAAAPAVGPWDPDSPIPP